MLYISQNLVFETTRNPSKYLLISILIDGIKMYVLVNSTPLSVKRIIDKYYFVMFTCILLNNSVGQGFAGPKTSQIYGALSHILYITSQFRIYFISNLVKMYFYLLVLN